MKAMVQDTYGSAEVLELRDIDKPEIGDDEVLVRVRAAGVNPADWAVMSGLPYIARPVYGMRKPKNAVRGTDVAGQVEAVGTGVTRFRPGDEVFGWCVGAYAEYASVSEDALALKPANLTFEQAAAVPMAGLVALQALRDHGNVQAGQNGLDQRCLGGHRHLRGADREVTRRPGDRRVQHAKRGPGPIDRRRPRHRLHRGGLHPKRAALRLHPRQRGEPFTVRPATRAHPDGNARAERRRVRQSLVRQRRSRDQSARVVTVREPQAAAVSRVAEA